VTSGVIVRVGIRLGCGGMDAAGGWQALISRLMRAAVKKNLAGKYVLIGGITQCFDGKTVLGQPPVIFYTITSRNPTVC